MFTLLRRATRPSGGWNLSRWIAVAAVSLGGITNLTAQAPSLPQPPSPHTIFIGDPATFQVGATGSAPLFYQWLRDGAVLPNATNNSYTIAAVTVADDDATFSVRVTNALGAVTSAPVALTVDLGIPGPAVTNRVLHFNSVWRYNLSNNFDAVNWIAPAYNDSAWPSGPALLGAENNSAITPLIGTVLPAPANPPPGLPQGHAYYFRTTLNMPSNNLAPGLLIATVRADDGAMIYVNGEEAHRLRMPAGPIFNNTLSTALPPFPSLDATGNEVFPLDIFGLSSGTNVIAVSVHQFTQNSSDLIWGMALDVVEFQRVRDTVAPTVTTLSPSAGSVLPAMNSLEVVFSEGVKGVQASDLIVNGAPATNVIEYAPDVYLFQFPPKPLGPVQATWAGNAGVIDLSANSNLFAGGTYNFTVDTSASGFNVRISEFLAGNDSGIRDEDGDRSDWIEIHNGGAESVNIGGWYITDEANDLNKWRLPNGLVLPPDAYLIVWASDKDRKILGAPLHTNFRISKAAGNFLGLVFSDGTTVMSSIASYPAQFDDISYGRDRLDSSFLGFFTAPTPGAANTTPSAGVAAAVQFSQSSGTFQSAFQLTLSSADPGAVIRYFLVTNAASAAITNVPNSSSPIYTGPLNISSSVQVRARAFSATPNVFPSEPTSETYLRITPSAAAFTSDLPLVLFHNFGGNTPPATVDQSAVMMVFDTRFGRASLTNPPAVASRIGINIRGSSTQDMPKKSFAVETWDEFNDDFDVEVLEMPAESDWVFYGPNLYDKAWIHNPLMHDLSRAIGRYSPRAKMVEVFTCFDGSVVNYNSPTVGHYNGIYVLMEKIKADGDRVDLTKLDPSHTNAPAITGGYMLKIDRADPDERTFSAASHSMVFVEPSMEDYNSYPGRALQQNYIAGYFNSFFSALTSVNWTNPVSGYAAWIDVDSWIDHHVLNTLALSCDALRLSAYFYKERDKKIEMGPLWDFDRGLGTSAGSDWRAWNPRSWMATNPLGGAGGGDYGTDYFNPAGVFSNPWYSRLVKDPNFWQKWIDRYQTLRDAEFSTNSIFAIIDALTNNLGTAQFREIARWNDSAPRSGLVRAPDGWPDRSYGQILPGTYAGEIWFLKRWFIDRLEFLDTNLLARPMLTLTSGPVTNGQTITITPAAKPNSRLLFTLNGTDPRLPGGAISPTAFSNNGPVMLTITNNVRIFARSWNPTHQNLTGTRNPPISSPWSGPANASLYTSIPALRVTEIMYHPPAPPPGNTNDAENFEFIELQNTGVTPLNVQGFQLTGGIEFTFPNLTVTGGQHVVVVKNLALFQSRYGPTPLVAGVYTNNLANSEEQIILRGALGEPILDFTYSDTWYPITDGEGFSLVKIDPLAAPETWNEKTAWRPSSALNGSPGVADPTPLNIAPIIINEVLTHTDPPLLDTIELFNPTLGDVDVGGWFLTDDPNEPKKFLIPNNSFIAAGGFMTFDTDDFGGGANGFAFGSTGDSVYLFSGDALNNLTGYAHGFTFGAAPNPVSFGRYLNSQAREFFVLQSVNTLGEHNAYPRVGPVIVSEIMYHPPDLPGGAEDEINEFIELQNIASTNVPLYDVNHPQNTWRLRDAVDFDFPPSVILAPDERVLIVGFDPNIFANLRSALFTKYNIPTNTLVLGPWTGKLSNNEDTVELERPDSPNVTETGTVVPYYAVEKIAYSDASPWPMDADGGGASLQRIEPTLFANDPLNWQAALPTAGQANPTGPTVDVDGDGLGDAWELAHGLDPQINSDVHGATADPDSDGANNLHEFIAGTDPNDSGDYLRFTDASVNNSVRFLEFMTQSGRTYDVEFATELASPTVWTPLTNGISGTGGIIVIEDTQNSTRYYRLKATLNQ